ncbi:STK32 [Lepeophtheirus salmonis]|uniref:STK32 n=1 Tax=Lepeophtheirus salmonis TaxID=72036 RepID=A0A7R8D6K3_LEPSM|nr:STK32 [Lepeophtheirus salmonis]CAF3041720.1 STK32 [Lepeophtheirus salmonis]
MGNKSSKKTKSSTPQEIVKFDDFEILRAIGRGSFGKVCLVERRDNDQLFAMKYVNKEACIRNEAVKNVVAEVELLQNLDHPFIVSLWFTFQDSEDLFIILEPLLGGDLRYHLCNGRKNILLDEMGHAHLTDFNIAIQLSGPDGTTNGLSGTKPYMAPEVFNAGVNPSKGYSFAVDWWSLGVTIFEIIAGHRPVEIHSRTSLSAIISLINEDRIKYPSSWSHSFIKCISNLLSLSPTKLRTSNYTTLLRSSYLHSIQIDSSKTTPNSFVPDKTGLNCDPTYELEEMIIESKPLHKKKKRLQREKSKLLLSASSTNRMTSSFHSHDSMTWNDFREFPTYNREWERYQLHLAEKERLWEEELKKIDGYIFGCSSCNC